MAIKSLEKRKLNLQYSLDPAEPEFVRGPHEFVQFPTEPAAVGPAVPAELYISEGTKL